MIEATGLTKRYGSTTAVDDLTFTVADGRVTGFLGPNGAGKSTTMRLIVGLDAPSSGRITVGGRPYRDRRFPLHEVGALLEAKAIHPSRSARNHLRWLAQSNGIRTSRVDEVLEQVGLAAVARKRAGTFSLGMSQRLGIAAALLGDPEVLLLDEPVNGLDPEGIQWVRQLLRSLASEGRTVFVSSHLMSEMALTADHLIVIGKGRLIADASVAEVIARASANHVKVVSPQANALRDRVAAAGANAEPAGDDTLIVTGLECREVGIIAAEAGITLYELSRQEASLEEAFMEMTRGSDEFHAGSNADWEHTVTTSEPIIDRPRRTGRIQPRRSPASSSQSYAPSGPSSGRCDRHFGRCSSRSRSSWVSARSSAPPGSPVPIGSTPASYATSTRPASASTASSWPNSRSASSEYSSSVRSTRPDRSVRPSAPHRNETSCSQPRSSCSWSSYSSSDSSPATAAFFIGQSILSGSTKLQHASIGDPGALRAVVGGAMYLSVLGALGIGLGTILRRTAGAIAALVGLLLILPILVNFLPSPWNTDISKYLPLSAGNNVFHTVKVA